MEGLIPMVYRTIKKNRSTRTRDQYLFSSPSPAAAASYNIADFYTSDEYVFTRNGPYANDDVVGGGFSANVDKVRHRRYKSFNVDNKGGGRLGFSPPPVQQQSQKLVLFRSHRFFSCVTGAP